MSLTVSYNTGLFIYDIYTISLSFYACTEEAKRKEAEAAARAKYNGEIKLSYEYENYKFTIIDGKIDSKTIDDKFSLSYVMPKCMIFLSDVSPSERCERESEMEDEQELPYILTEKGSFYGLLAGEEYWVSVEENDDERRKVSLSSLSLSLSLSQPCVATSNRLIYISLSL